MLQQDTVATTTALPLLRCFTTSYTAIAHLPVRPAVAHGTALRGVDLHSHCTSPPDEVLHLGVTITGQRLEERHHPAELAWAHQLLRDHSCWTLRHVPPASRCVARG